MQILTIVICGLLGMIIGCRSKTIVAYFAKDHGVIKWTSVHTLVIGLVFLLSSVCLSYTDNGVGQLSYNLLVLSLLVLMSVIDVYCFRLPYSFTLPLLGIGILHVIMVGSGPSLISSLSGFIIAGGLFWGIHQLVPKGLGFGDVMLVAALGVILGLGKVLVALLVGCFVGSLLGLFLRLKYGKRLTQTALPFGPFLAFGTWISLVCGSQVLSWYGEMICNGVTFVYR